MFLQIQKRMEIDLHNSKSFAFLATDISKLLNLSREHRTVDGLIYLEEKMNEYNSLVDLSIVTDVQLDEKILELDLIDNLTPEEQLNILSNDNLQSIFRRYDLRFLKRRRSENSEDKDQDSRLRRNGSISSHLSAMMAMRGSPPPRNSPRSRHGSNPPTVSDAATEFYNIYNNRPSTISPRRSGSRPGKSSYYTNQMASHLAQQMSVSPDPQIEDMKRDSELPMPNDTTQPQVDIEAPASVPPMELIAPKPIVPVLQKNDSKSTISKEDIFMMDEYKL